MSVLKQKVLLLLFGGINLYFAYTPERQWRAIKTISKEWRELNQKNLRKEINNLYRSKIIEKKENFDGTTTIKLTNKGKIKALTYHFEKMRIDKRDWDNKWRIIVFDVPERLRRGRDALREKLKKLGFYELQKSVLVFPYECENEINFLIEFFEIKKYVRFGILERIDNESHLKEIFGIK